MMASVSGDSGPPLLQSALRSAGSCSSCLSRQRTDICRLYGPSWKTVVRCCRAASECNECKPSSGPKLVSLLSAWLSDRSYVCDGRCGSSEPSSACSRVSKSHLVSHFKSAQAAERCCVSLSGFTESTYHDLLHSLCVRKDDLFKLLKETVTCIGCRTFVETLFTEFFNESLGFLRVSGDGDVCISELLLDMLQVPLPCASCSPHHHQQDAQRHDPQQRQSQQSLQHVPTGHGNGAEQPEEHGCNGSTFASFCHTLLSVSESVLWDEIEMTCECKKIRNARAKRCALHTLESHRSTKCHGWREIWELLEEHEREQICQLDTGSLHSTISAYVQKHKFCIDCKAKVMRAFAILAGELDSKCEKGYMSPLYKGFRGRKEEGVIELSPTTAFIHELIIRATPEALAVGTPNEVHAKTFDTAQEQVLLCVGLQLLKDLHQYAMACHLEYRAERLLILTSLMAVTRQYQTALNAAGCSTALDSYEAEQQQLQLKKKEKRLRKKKRKQQQQQELQTLSESTSASAGGRTCASATSAGGSGGISQNGTRTGTVRGSTKTQAHVSGDGAGEEDVDGVDPEEEEDTKEDSDDADCHCAAVTSTSTLSSAYGSGCPKDHPVAGLSSSTTSTASSMRRVVQKRTADSSSSSRASAGKVASSSTSMCTHEEQDTDRDSSPLSDHCCTSAKESLSSSDSGCQADGLLYNISDDEKVFLSKMGWTECYDEEDDAPCISQSVIDAYMANKSRHDEERQALRQNLWQSFEKLNCHCLRKR